jgi:hypothetical protein
MPILSDIDIRNWPPNESEPYAFPAIEALYLQCLNRFKNDSVSKVLVWISESLTLRGHEFPRYRFFKEERHIDIYVLFDPLAFKKLSSLEKQRQVLDWLQACLLEIAEKFNWRLEPFEAAYQHCLANQFVYTKRRLGPLSNRSRTLRYSLWAKLDDEQCLLEVRAENRGGEEVWRKPVLTFFPNRYYLWQLCGSLKWVDNETLKVVSRADNMGSDEFAMAKVQLAQDVRVIFLEKYKLDFGGETYSNGSFVVEIPVATGNR